MDDKTTISPSAQCIAAGLDSLAEFSRLSTVSDRTLINWHKHTPVKFEVMLLGAVVKKKNHTNELHKPE